MHPLVEVKYFVYPGKASRETDFIFIGNHNNSPDIDINNDYIKVKTEE